MDERPWHDKRTKDDAPEWMSPGWADAWASGWNAAVRECSAQQDRIFLKELGK